ncbi:hypothetical protein M422DRAFT_270790, partial [Sphaerobolus stellatus SS14]
ANGALGESDAAAILALIQNLQPEILTASTNIATKKSLFDALPITGLGSLAKADLKTLSTDTSVVSYINPLSYCTDERAFQAFEIALINAFPADIRADAVAVTSTILNAAFTTAIVAYASEA